jgi:autoinducer 2-degrading protein
MVDSGDPMIALTVRLTVKAGREQETADMFRSYVKLVQTEPGCSRFDVLQSRKDPREFLLYELYKDDAALDAHRRTPHFLDYSPKIADLEEKRDSELFNCVA